MEAPRKPLQVMHISRKDEQERLNKKSEEELSATSQTSSDNSLNSGGNAPEILSHQTSSMDRRPIERTLDIDDLEGISMGDLLGPSDQSSSGGTQQAKRSSQFNKPLPKEKSRSVDDFDFP